MNGFDALGFVTYIFAAGIMAGTPILLAALGEILTERSGLMNLGVEGMMLVGAITAFMFTNISGNRWIGMLGAVILCGILGLAVAFLLIRLRANQVATGMAFLIFAAGLSSVLGKPYLGVVAEDSFKRFSIPQLDNYPKLQQILQQDEMVIVAVVLAVVIWFILFRTRWGLYIRSAGDDPAALDCVGVNVYKVRYISFVVGCMLCAMGGAYLSTGYSLFWIENMTAGRGWMAIALVNFALWNPLYAVIGSYLFGIFHILSLRLETLGVAISPYFLRMIPYILPIIILVLMKQFNKGKTQIAPKTIGVPYLREGK